MTYSILNGRLVEGAAGQIPVHVEGYAPDALPKDPGDIPPRIFASAFGHTTSHFESHEFFDLICYEPVDILVPERISPPMCVFMEADHMHFYSADPRTVSAALDAVAASDLADLTPGELLYCFLAHQLAGDRALLEQLETSLNQLEDEVLTGSAAAAHYNRRLIALRKHLVRVRRHYEQLGDLFGDLSANENALFDKRALRQLALLDGKVARLCQKTTGLLDYVSQIREAYQAEVDISLNKTMQVLTIITVIVLPLTLIAGWYGMNLQMPEYSLPLAYPAVIALSVLVIVGCVVYFKKHKWF